MPGNDGKGRRLKENLVINFSKWSFTDTEIEEDQFSIEMVAPEDLFRSFKNLGRKFYAQGTLTQDVDEGEEGWEADGFIYPSGVKLYDADGFRVRLYRIEERKLLKEIFDFLNARHDFNNV